MSFHSAGASDRPEVLVFDLFGTLVDLDWSALPRMSIDGRDRVVTIEGLEDLLREARPDLGPGEFLTHLEDVGRLVLEAKRRRPSEQSSALRFRLALERAGVGAGCNAVAVEMSLRHMRSLAGAVRYPEARRRALASLSTRYRVALLSNFDHGPTGRAILDATGLSRVCEVSLISDELGARKPQGVVFERMARLLDVAPRRCWYIGDTFEDDIEGAAAAGFVPVWVDASDKDPAPALLRIGDAADLPGVLALRYGEVADR
jgi:HAD superfamily hydrolase (TIGR01549 family)